MYPLDVLRNQTVPRSLSTLGSPSRMPDSWMATMLPWAARSVLRVTLGFMAIVNPAR